MSYGEALKLIGGLSKPSKMPWWSWSIDAAGCITGSKLAEQDGTVCSSCYALKGNYVFGNVKDAQARRLAGSQTDGFVDAFVLVLQNIHEKTRKRRADGRIENRFRWFDAGDIQSVEMLEKINEIARRTPGIDHWLPTREVRIVRDFLAKHGAFAPNLIVRYSTPIVRELPKSRTLGLPFATVGCDASSSVKQCRALVDQGNRCLDCAACWTKQDVNYPLH